MLQSACCYHFLLRFESFSKMEGYEGYFIRWTRWSILTFFTIFDISPLWMDRFGWNWWPNWRFFDALIESGKIFDWYDPQYFGETLEAGVKKRIFLSFWLLQSQNKGTTELEKDKKNRSKLNYSSRSNQWCNRHVNMAKKPRIWGYPYMYYDKNGLRKKHHIWGNPYIYYDKNGIPHRWCFFRLFEFARPYRGCHR